MDIEIGAKGSDFSTVDRSLVIPEELSLLPIKDTVLFPMVVMPLIVSREAERYAACTNIPLHLISYILNLYNT